MDKRKHLIDTLESLIKYAWRHTCLHEETHRGGIIWEICDHCGMQWADDMGGKPEDAHDIPKPISDAEELLEMLRRK